MDKVLDKLINAFGVSGREEEVRNVIKELINKSEATVYEDKVGNLIVRLGQGKEKLMFCANMDEIGFITTYVKNNSTVKVENIGDFNMEQSVNSLVRFKDGTVGKLVQVKNKTGKGDFYIDLGLNVQNSIKSKIHESSVACLNSETAQTGRILIGPGLNNRVGCYILLRLIKEITANNKEVYFVFSVEKELGGRGARAAAYAINPDYCIVVDLQKAGDIKDGEEAVKIGEGPVITIKDSSLIIHHQIKEMLEAAAKKTGIKLQYAVSDGLSDGGAIQKEREGIKTGRISVPCRYIHTASEMICVDDVEKAVKLLSGLI